MPALARHFLVGMLVIKLFAPSGDLPAQQAIPPKPGASAATYETRYEELRALAPRPDRGAEVRNLVLTRDAGTITLEQGSLFLLSDVGGRTIGAAFHGKGGFTFAPPDAIERDRVARFFKTPTLQRPFTRLVLLFADSTAEELARRLAFKSLTPSPEMRGEIKTALDFLTDDQSKTVDVDIMATALNDTRSDLFYAHFSHVGNAVLFAINPEENESVRLAKPFNSGLFGEHFWETVSQSPRAGDRVPATTYSRRARLQASEYTANISLSNTGSGDVAFVSTARIDLSALEPTGPWFAMRLFSKLVVDSVRWDGGAPATFFKGKDSPYLWLHTGGPPLTPGQRRTLTVHYHGDLIDRFGDEFFIKTGGAWLPEPLEGQISATYDLTYRFPGSLTLASVGELKDSSRKDRQLTTRWVTPGPVKDAAFNLGRFERHEVRLPGVPNVTVLSSEAAHKSFSRFMRDVGRPELTRQKHMKETVGSDVANSLKFYQSVYGPSPVPSFYATEIPYSHGQAFPGLVHLAFSTFQQTSQDGFDEVFRAHEVAHQWWGIAVDYATYHDQWLSEGFSSFSGLWYLQSARKDNKLYFGLLDRWRANIMNRRDEPAPISLGYRTSSTKDPAGYGVIIYEKGAWVMHMLRVLMLDLKDLKEDRFTNMMKDFYATYRGKRATTADFERVVSRHAGTDMSWFFRQWVHGSDVPKYQVGYTSDEVPGGGTRVRMRVEQSGVPADFQMYVPVTVELDGNRFFRTRVLAKGPRTMLELPRIPGKVKKLIFNDLHGVLAEDVSMVSW